MKLLFFKKNNAGMLALDYKKAETFTHTKEDITTCTGTINVYCSLFIISKCIDLIDGVNAACSKQPCDDMCVF